VKKYIYTLEQLVQLRHAFSQRKFAEEAAHLIPTTERIHAEITETGLLLAAIGELDLEGVVETLQQKYEMNLAVGKPAVRYVSEPVLLEPYMNVEVITPASFVGSVAGDLNNRKALITEMEDFGDMKRVRVEVPLSMMFGYATVLRVLTAAKGSFTMDFLEYRPVQSGN
jgi:translation elongation factor EF-G